MDSEEYPTIPNAAGCDNVAEEVDKLTYGDGNIDKMTEFIMGSDCSGVLDEDNIDEHGSVFEEQHSNSLFEENCPDFFKEETREQGEEDFDDWLAALRDKMSTPKHHEDCSVRSDEYLSSQNHHPVIESDQPEINHYFNNEFNEGDGKINEATNSHFHAPEEHDYTLEYASNGILIPVGEGENPDGYVYSENENEQRLEHEIEHLYRSKENGSIVNDKDQIKHNDHGLQEHLASSSENAGYGQVNSVDETTKLKILYEARGRTIANLYSEIEHMKEEHSKEIQMLKHNLILAQGDVKGNQFSLQQAQEILKDKNEENLALKAEVTASQCRIVSEQKAKEEVIEKLKGAEMTISSLQKQIDELSQAENFARMKKQYEATIDNLKLNHGKETLLLKTEIDKLEHQLKSLKDENETLQHELQKQQHSFQEFKLQKADTINRLTKSLDASQMQCQKLLESGNSQSVSHLKEQITQLEISKIEAENCLKVLQGEVKSLRAELETFENVSKMGLLGSENIEEIDESAAQLGLRSRNRSYTTEDLTTSLKSELQKSLLNLRSRRNELLILQTKLTSSEREAVKLKKQLGNTENRLAKAEFRIKELEKQLASNEVYASSVSSLQHQKEVADLQNKIDLLNERMMEKNHQIEELSEIKEKLESEHVKIKRDMQRNLEEKEKEKENALKKCSENALQLRQEAVEKVRHTSEACLQHEREKLTKEYEKQIAALKSEIETTLEKMHKVKEFSIKVCEERDLLERKVEKLDAASIEYRCKLQAHYEEEKLQSEKEMQKKFDEELIRVKEIWENNAFQKFKRCCEQQKHELMEQWNRQKAIDIQNEVEKVKREYHQQLTQKDRENKDDIAVQTENLDDKENKLAVNLMQKKLEMEWKNKMEATKKLHEVRIKEMKEIHDQDIEETISKLKTTYTKEKEEALKHSQIKNEHLKQEIQSLEKELNTLKSFVPPFDRKKNKNGNSSISNDAAPKKEKRLHNLVEHQEYESQHTVLLDEIKTLKEALEKSLEDKLQMYSHSIQLSGKKNKEEIAKLTAEFHSVADSLKAIIVESQKEETEKKQIQDLKKKYEQELLELKRATININKQDAFCQTCEDSKEDMQAWKDNFLKELKEFKEKTNMSLLLNEDLSKERMNQVLHIFYDLLVHNLANKLRQDMPLTSSGKHSHQYGSQITTNTMDCHSALITNYLDNIRVNVSNSDSAPSLHFTSVKDFSTTEKFSSPTFEPLHSMYTCNKRTEDNIANVLNKKECPTLSSVHGITRPAFAIPETLTCTDNRDINQWTASNQYSLCAERPLSSGTE